MKKESQKFVTSTTQRAAVGSREKRISAVATMADTTSKILGSEEEIVALSGAWEVKAGKETNEPKILSNAWNFSNEKSLKTNFGEIVKSEETFLDRQLSKEDSNKQVTDSKVSEEHPSR